AGTLQSLGADISAEQAALQSAWQGDTGMSYQAWQAQWNQALEQLVLSYRAMASTHENNTTSMLARDSAEGAKWGGWAPSVNDQRAQRRRADRRSGVVHRRN